MIIQAPSRMPPAAPSPGQTTEPSITPASRQTGLDFGLQLCAGPDGCVSMWRTVAHQRDLRERPLTPACPIPFGGTT